MSAALAIAATSEVLRYIVEAALAEVGKLYGFPAPGVTTGAPPRPPTAPGPEPAAVNLFLHAASPNAAMRSHPGPVRDAGGKRLNNAPLVLNLQYLLSAHGPEALREIGLGTAMHALHQLGLVPRSVIRDALARLNGNGEQAKAALAEHERLADQLESLTISTLTQDLDALTKLWSATQSPLRPSASYLVTAVFLEEERPQRTILPVLTPSLAAVPLRVLTVHSVSGSKGSRPWPLTAEAELVILGEGFAESGLEVALGGAVLQLVAGHCGPHQLVAAIAPNDVAGLRAGPVTLTVTLPGLVGGRTVPVQSTTTSLLLRPSPTTPPVPGVPDTPGSPGTVSGPLEVTVTPPVGRHQRANLRLTRIDGTEPSVAVAWKPPASAAAEAFTQLTFELKKAPKGTYRLQLEVDGVASQPMPDAAGVFQPQVTL